MLLHTNRLYPIHDTLSPENNEEENQTRNHVTTALHQRKCGNNEARELGRYRRKTLKNVF